MRPFTNADVVFSAQAGCVLEASVDKPGNVGPGHDFEDTRFTDFLLSGIAIGDAVRRAVEFGMLYKTGEEGIGALIRAAVEDSTRRHRGKNTNLGMAMLAIPLSASAGICIDKSRFSLGELRKGVSKIINGSTPEDTVELYNAITSSNAEVGRSDRFDVTDPKSTQKVLEKGLNLSDIFEISKWDSVSKELVSEMEITFTIGCPTIKDEFEKNPDIKVSILRCFFEVLSKVPDTLIARKNTRDIAIEVSNEARAVLEKGLNPKDIAAFDSKLRSHGNKYNPGTTADLTASSIMVAFLDGVFLDGENR
jgi:triphosphoribosyl-dephospho-CoA synthase